MASEKLIQALKTALQNEEKSVQLYKEAGEKSNNPVIKKSMEFLSKWEQEHYNKIKRMYSHLIGELEIFDIRTECSEDPLCVVKEFFGKNIDDFKEKFAGHYDELQVYLTGMEIEIEGKSFYEKAALETDDKQAKQLFEFLAAEEVIHHKFLENEYKHLMNPESWPMNEQDWFPIT
jgi:rubrerythrin